MSGGNHRRSGFSLVEVMVAATVLVVAIAVAFTGFLHTMKAENLNRFQNELDTQVQESMENVKYRMRLSSLEEMYFYPAGPGPYTAVSFPDARDDDGDGAVETNAFGGIDWDRQLVYHVWSGSPTELRLTIFDPRNDALTPAQRQAQIDSVVAVGYGTATHESAGATTKTLFENLFDWSITPEAPPYDAYADELSRDVGRPMGFCVLSNGTHTFTFTVLGQNASSTGRRIGLDTLVVGPCPSEREAEAQTVSAQSGATATPTLMSGVGSWSGNYQLLFPATADGHSFTLTMENDRWEETNFTPPGYQAERVVIGFDTTLSPQDYVVKLDGYGYSWNAYEQTGQTNQFGLPLAAGYDDPNDSLRNCAVRVLLRGDEMENGGWLKYSGGKSWVYFSSGGVAAGDALRIEKAYIAECVPTNKLTANIVDGSSRRLSVWGSPGTLSFDLFGVDGRWTYSDLVDFPIDREKSYIVSFLVSSAANKGHARYWIENRDTPRLRGCYVITNGTEALLTTADWDALSPIETNRLYAVQYLYTSYPTNGLYTSAIQDTSLLAPGYRQLLWNAEKPAGSYVGVKVRTGDNSDLSDAPGWSNIAAYVVSPAAINPGNKRYVQFQTRLEPSASGFETPKLRNVTVRWQGETRLVDISATLTRGPDYGIWNLKVDGQELKRGLNVNLSIFKDVRGYRGDQRLTSALTTELWPRNTGR